MAGLPGDGAPPGRSDSDFGTSLPMPPQVNAPSHVQVQMDDDDQYTPGGYTPSARPGSGGRSPRTATPLTPQEVTVGSTPQSFGVTPTLIAPKFVKIKNECINKETISKNVSGVKENLEKMTSKNPARPTTAADLQGLVSRMQQQEAEIARILNNRGFPALPPVEVAEVPVGADEDVKEMYLTRGAAALGQQMEEIENRLVYDANGNLVPDGHVNSKALQPYKEPLPEKQTELMDVAEYMHQYQGMTKEEESFESEGYQEYRPKSGLSFFGILLQIMYLGACGLYIYVRVRYTLPPLSSHLAYGIIILMVEILGMISVNLFTITLMFSSKLEPALEQQFKRDYHVRVLIPCYKESLAIIKQTIMACLAAEVPDGCKRTIYLCDDGKDAKKREWMLSMEDPCLVYVTGRKRPPGEANGKSGNLNNCLKLIYPKGLAIGYGEVMCLFDADQVCSRSFFTKMLPLIDSGDNVAISLSPQCVYNIKPGQDIFNRSNVQFWEVMLPGYDALGFISCTGTNMLIRCRALKECGWFPTTTVTEDWELGMWMKKYGWICRYMPEYLAVGEAPLEVRQAFQQRSRWCKGHFQTFFSKACPAFDSKLNFPMRILYSGTVISYFSTGISVPLFSLVPIIAICWGIFPLALNFWAALGITVFYASTMIVLFNATNFRRLMALYFVQVSNYILWWTYLKGAVLTPIKIIAGKGLTFKVTNKGNKGGFDFPVRDLFMPVAISVLSTVAVVFGLVHIDLEVSAAIALSICWCVWNSIPGYLLLAYTFVGQGKTMRLLCLFSFLLSSVMSTMAIILMWLLYPRDYDQEDLLRKSLQFMDAQRSGEIDKSIGPIWRQSAQTTLQVNVNNTIFDLSGGFYSGGYGGNSKVVSNIAYSTVMLAWAVLSYQGGFRDAGALDRALSHINQGAIYLMKSHVYNATAPGRTVFFPQAGNLTYEYRSQWERPEDLDIRLNQLAATGDFSLTAEAYPVPYFTAEDAYATGQWLQNGAGVGDLAAQMSAALTAASLAVSIEPKLASNAQMYIDRAGDLFSLSLKYPGLYTQLPWLKYDYDNAFMGSTSYKDDQTFAAAWLYRATNAAGQATTGELNDLLDLVTRLYSDAVLEWNDDGTWVSQDRILRAATVMMAIEATDRVFDSDARKFLDNFICAEEPIELTKKDRIWHPKAPYLGEDAVLAFLMAQYGDFATGVARNHRRSYRCKAMSQLRYFIGDRGQGFIAGYGPKPPERVQHVGSTCQPFPADCPASNRFSGQPNVNKLYGALVYGQPEDTDDYNDRRELKSSRVSLVNNAGLPGLVGFAVQTNLYWMECLQEGGYFSKHPMC